MKKLKEDISEDELTDHHMYSALSFCVMLMVVGVPLWWKTTEVYRVSLPYSEIDKLHEYNIQILMNIHMATIDDSHGASLVDDLKNYFRISKLYKVKFRQHLIDKAVLGSSKTLEEIEQKIKHPQFEGSLQLFEIPGLSRFTPNDIILGQNRTIYFSSNTDGFKLYNFLTSKILNEESLLNIISQVKLPKKSNLNQNSKRKIPPSEDFDILFTILNPDPEFLDIQFNISEAIEEYISPLLEDLKDMNRFHIKSQWLYFVNLQVQPKLVNNSDKGSHFALSEDLLPHVITPLEKKLASHVSKYPCLNFVLFIPPCSLSPLHIYTRKGYQIEGANAFISPRWGGVQITNPNSFFGVTSCQIYEYDRSGNYPPPNVSSAFLAAYIFSSLYETGNLCFDNNKIVFKPEKPYVMSVFLQQLKLLLGISELSEVKEKDIINTAVHLRVWEKDSLLKMRTIEQLTSAKLTLQSLSKLLGKINNIVINDQVGEAICSAVERINDATKALAEGKLMKAYHNSKKAFSQSETAFTDPSLLALLYFPDDQKYAVYIPLFLPIMIPVLISLKHVRQWILGKFKKTKVD